MPISVAQKPVISSSTFLNDTDNVTYFSLRVAEAIFRESNGFFRSFAPSPGVPLPYLMRVNLIASPMSPRSMTLYPSGVSQCVIPLPPYPS